MNKEIIICIIIVILVFSLNIVTQKYTEKVVGEVTTLLDATREELTKEEPDFEIALKKADEAYNKWEELDDTWALYIEHNEIEKVTTAITAAKSFSEMNNNEESVDSIDRCKFILQHIKEREQISLDNIF